MWYNKTRLVLALLILITLISSVNAIAQGFDVVGKLTEAKTLYYKGELSECIKIYKEVLSSYPDEDEVRLDLAAVYKDIGQPDKALDEYEYILSKGRGGVDILFELGWNLFCVGKYEKALETLNQVQRLDPTRSDLFYILGLSAAQLGRVDEAVQYLNTAIQLEPANALAHLSMGRVLDAMGELQDAAYSYETALKYEPSLKIVHPLVADVYLRLKEEKSALEALYKAVKVEPSDKVAASKLEELEVQRPDLVQAKIDAKAAARKALTLSKVMPPPNIETLPKVRVRIMDDAGEIKFQTSGHFSFVCTAQILVEGGPGEEWALSRQGNAFHIIKDGVKIFETTCPKISLIKDDPGDVILFYDVSYGTGYFWAGEEDRSYRGNFEFIANTKDGRFTVINEVSVEEYLYSVVPSEMPSYWPFEALKTQTIAARTYTLRRLNNSGEYHLDSSVQSAYYKGVKGEATNTTRAVDATQGQVLYYHNSLVDAVYSSNNGGYVESSLDIWGGYVPYLIGKEDSMEPLGSFPLAPAMLHEWIKTSVPSFSRPDKHGSNQTYRWRLVVSRSEIERNLRSRGRDVGTVLEIMPLERGEGGVVKSVRFQGTNGEITMKGDSLRSLLGGLKSNRFIMETWYNDGVPEEFFFYGSGFGHLVGMSQTGAANMAAQGYDYIQILGHYYPKTEIKRAYR